MPEFESLLSENLLVESEGKTLFKEDWGSGVSGDKRVVTGSSVGSGS